MDRLPRRVVIHKRTPFKKEEIEGITHALTQAGTHYTSPTVIQAIYEAVDRMGFETGNILEPDVYKRQDHGSLFGVDHEEWEKSPKFHEKVMERQEHQQEREQAFLSQNRDCFAIYQVSRDDPQNVRFMNLDWLKSHDISIDRSNYDLIYTAPLSESGTVPEQLEKL